MERWKDVPGYEGLYRVSNLGRVKSVAREIWNGAKIKQRILKQWSTRTGYIQVDLGRTNGKRNTFTVHALVLRSFVGECPNGMQCRHLDGDSKNNRLENLCWGTPRENHEDRVRHGTANYLVGMQCPYAKLNDDDVRDIRRLYATGKIPQWKLGKMFGLHQVTVSEIVTRKIWKHVD